MLRNVQTTSSLSISNYLGANKQLLDVIYSGKCILITGPDLAAQIPPVEEKALSPYLKRLLEGMVQWSIQEKIIHDYSIIEDFHRIIRQESWTEAGYKLEEYLAEKSQQQQCLREVIGDLARISEIHGLLVRLPFLAYITTAYDTFIETAYFEAIKSWLPKFYQSSIQEAIEAYQSKQHFILKLYGDIDNPTSIALGHRFNQGLLNANYQDQLRKLLTSGPVLFCGFENADPDLEVLKKLVENGSHAHQDTYWVVAPQGQVPELEVDDLEQRKRISAITYEVSEKYTELAPLLATVAPPNTINTVNTQTLQENGSSPRTRQKRKSSLAEPNLPITIFAAYARRDAELLEQLKIWLNMLKFQKGLNIEWECCEITETWKLDISDPLNKSNIVLLLFSPDFCASEYCRSKSMKQAVKRHKNGAWISPVLLRPCLWNEALFGNLAFLPSNRVYVTTWQNVDAAFQDVALGIEIAIRHLASRPRR